MPQVTIDIAGVSGGNNSGGSDNAQNQANDNSQGSTPQTVVLPPNDRLVDELRNMLMEQAASNKPQTHKYDDAIKQVEQMQRQQISSQYDERRQSAQERMTSRYDEIDRTIDQKIDTEAVQHKGWSDDEIQKNIIDKYNVEREELYKKAGQQYDDEIAQIDKEQSQKEDELTQSIKELTEQIRKSGDINPNSYLAELRAERNRAIIERDTAADEQSARDAAQRVRQLDRQIRNVESGRLANQDDEESEDQTASGMRVLATMSGVTSLLSGAAGGNISSMITGVAKTGVGLSGATGSAASKALGWTAVIAIIGGLIQQSAERDNQMAALAALVRNDRTIGGGDIQSTRQGLLWDLQDYTPNGSLPSIYNMGLNNTEFAQSAARRIRQRGSMQQGVSEAYYQEALERVFSLDSGALGQAGRNDIYGINATNAIVDLVERLSRIQNSGVSQGNYARVQQFLDMQQALMQTYGRFQNNPNVTLANREIEAFSQIRGYTIDSRTSGTINDVRSMITNPRNDRMRAILYDTVQELMPQTAGRYDLIERAINDPLQQGKIIRAFIQNIQRAYGGTDTMMGFEAARYALPNVPMGQLDAIWNSLANGQAGRTWAYGDWAKTNKGDYRVAEKDKYAQEVQGYNSATTQGLLHATDAMFTLTNKINDLVELMNDIAMGRKDFSDIVVALLRKISSAF